MREKCQFFGQFPNVLQDKPILFTRCVRNLNAVVTDPYQGHAVNSELADAVTGPLWQHV